MLRSTIHVESFEGKCLAIAKPILNGQGCPAKTRRSIVRAETRRTTFLYSANVKIFSQILGWPTRPIVYLRTPTPRIMCAM